MEFEEIMEQLPAAVDVSQPLGCPAHRLERYDKRGIIVVVRGRTADSTEIEDDASAIGVVLGGPHHLHWVKIDSAKHNCGAYDEYVQCQCGAERWSGMYGCRDHQRPAGEEGTPLPLEIIETRNQPLLLYEVAVQANCSDAELFLDELVWLAAFGVAAVQRVISLGEARRGMHLK